MDVLLVRFGKLCRTFGWLFHNFCLQFLLCKIILKSEVSTVDRLMGTKLLGLYDK